MCSTDSEEREIEQNRKRQLEEVNDEEILRNAEEAEKEVKDLQN